MMCVTGAKGTEEARDILSNLFNSASDVDLELMRFMLIEVCVCVFHGFSSQETVGQTDPLACVSRDSEQHHHHHPHQQEQVEQQHQETEKALGEKCEFRESKLGREPLSGVGVEKADDDFQYDEYSDDSHGDTSYSGSEWEAACQDSGETVRVNAGAKVSQSVNNDS